MFDFPGIYQEADNISNKTQKCYLLVLKLYLTILIIASILFTYFNNVWEVKIVNAILSLVILALSFVFFCYDFQGIWYNARAVAESIKTSCWRFAIKAEPYNVEDEEADEFLLNTMKHIIGMNRDFQKHITACFSCNEQLPSSLTKIRLLPLEKRRDFYHNYRVLEQELWYKNKSEYNNKKSKLFFALLVLLSLIISVFLFLSLDKTNSFNYPVEILLSLLSIIFTWVQTKKYKELNKSYALASYEIGFISSQKNKITSEEQLSEYVDNSENAFSREHTQWIARKDN